MSVSTDNSEDPMADIEIISNIYEKEAKSERILLLHSLFPTCTNYEIHFGLSPGRSFSPVIVLKNNENGTKNIFN